jgi:hypothetical protein
MDPQIARLFWSPSLPEHWVGEDAEGKLYLFPTTANGWAQRQPYLGHRESLRPAEPQGELLRLLYGAAEPEMGAPLAAQYAGVARATMAQALREGRVEARRSGAAWLVTRSAIDAAIAAGMLRPKKKA